MINDNTAPKATRAYTNSTRPADGSKGSIFINKTELLFIFSPDMSITYANPPCCEHFNRKLEYLQGENFLNFVFDEDREAFRKALGELNAEHPVLTYEYPTTNAQGETAWHGWTTRSIFSTAGKLMEFQAIGRDITQHRQSEKALLEAKHRYESIVEDQMELVCRYLPDYTLTFVNESYCQYHGKRREELIGKDFTSTIGLVDFKNIKGFLNSATPENPIQTTAQCIHKNDGEILWVEWRRRALFDNKLNMLEIQSVGRDVTELKKAEKALREKNEQLERKNAALTEVLEQIEQKKQQIKNEVIANTEELLIPLIDLLESKGSKLDSQYLNLLKRSLEDLTSSFGRKVTEKTLKYTPRELQICNMIRRGLSSKEIANLLNLSLNTVGRHRHSIRKKANITNDKVNLNTFLKSL
jgi:PAS domain S-box-containing protein